MIIPANIGLGIAFNIYVDDSTLLDRYLRLDLDLRNRI